MYRCIRVWLVAILFLGTSKILADDCNANGIEDAEDIQSVTSQDCDANGIPDECERTPLPFHTQTHLQTDGALRQALSGDFDGDGSDDVLLTYARTAPRIGLPSGKPGGLSVFLNDGDRFDTSSSTAFPVDGRLRAWSSGDLDGDGALDVAVTNDTHVALLYGDGTGSFGTPVSLTTASGVWAIDIDDLNGDQVDDMVVSIRTVPQVVVLLSQGDRTFQPLDGVSVPIEPRILRLADVDGDTVVDVLVRHLGDDQSVSILTNDGNGALSATGSIGVGVTIRPILLVEDFTGDGRVDVMTATSDDLRLFINESDTTWTESILLPNNARTPNAATSGDIDADGDADVVASFIRPNRTYAFVNRGDGTFNAPQPINLEIFTSAIELVDLDNDGDQDFFAGTVDKPEGVIYWNSIETAAPVIRMELAEHWPGVDEPHAADIGDIDRDGDLDLVVSYNIGSPAYSIFRNSGDGTFPVRETFDGFSAFSLVVSDLDIDGHLDVVFGDFYGKTGLLIKYNDKQGGLEPHVQYGGSGAFYDLCAVDVDGDARPDVLAAHISNTVSVYFNDGNRVFTEPLSLNVGSSSYGVAAADLNRDGRVDVICANNASADVSVLFNHGDRTFSEAIHFPLTAKPNAVIARDFDLDGRIDLATCSHASSVVELLWNEGAASPASLFSPPTVFPTGDNPYDMLSADFNDDGYEEIISVDQFGNTLSVLHNSAARGFHRPIRLDTGVAPRHAMAGDIDGDGDIDLIGAQHGAADLSIILNLHADRPRPDFVRTVCTEESFFQISLPATLMPGRVAKYLLPAHDHAELLPTTFQNVRRFELHEGFLRDVFPDEFAGLSSQAYDALVGRRATRDYYVGAITRIRDRQDLIYAFTVVADTGFDAQETLTLAEIQDVYAKLSESFELETLAYRPDTRLAREAVALWTNPGFPIFLSNAPPSTAYEAYTLGTAYGRVRVLTLQEFEVGSNAGLFTFQDILVVEQAPRDLQGIVAALVTGEPQGRLSHSSIRLARRGTPNAFVGDALTQWAPYADQLVRVEILPKGWSVSVATPEEAAAFWTRNRPAPPELPAFDSEYQALDSFDTMDLSSVSEARFGGKASNLARLRRVLTGKFEAYREPGFGIPMHYYREFMEHNTVVVGEQELTYDEYLRSILENPDVQTDSSRRRAALEGFRDFVRENATLNQELVLTLALRIEEEFGSTTRMVRFRSSSNTEDALTFNGAGLYESTSVCAADTTDAGDRNGSHCDPTRLDERTIERALKKVWSSLWTFRAYEERNFFRIPQDNAAMGIAVTRAFLDETANFVALSGNPNDPFDRRYLINAQVGEESVVSPTPGVTVERTVLEVVDGEVINILRDQESSLTPSGVPVLSDDQLREIGAVITHVTTNLDVDYQGHPPEQVLLDFEGKVEPNGSLAFKQVRPFLIPTIGPPPPTFELDIPAGTELCGVFRHESPNREAAAEYAVKSSVLFRSGRFELPTRTSHFSLDIVDELRFGAEDNVAQATGLGQFRVLRIPDAGDRTIYRFQYSQTFELPTGETFELKLFNLPFTARGEVVLDPVKSVDEDQLTFRLAIDGEVDGTSTVTFASCTYSLLPEWELDLELEDDSHITLRERWLDMGTVANAGPASLVGSTIQLGETKQTVEDYWRLVYAARRHNRDARYWTILSPAATLAGLANPVHAVEVEIVGSPHDGEPVVRLLDANFSVLAEPAVTRFTRREIVVQPAMFQRGDVDGNGAINIADVVAVIRYLVEGGVTTSCRKAADANDNGAINLADAVTILLHLFGSQRELPSPRNCGQDPTVDLLPCDTPSACQQ